MANSSLARVVAATMFWRRKRSIWVKPWIERRTTLGVYGSLLQELKQEDLESFNNSLHIDNFEEPVFLGTIVFFREYNDQK